MAAKWFNSLYTNSILSLIWTNSLNVMKQNWRKLREQTACSAGQNEFKTNLKSNSNSITQQNLVNFVKLQKRLKAQNTNSKLCIDLLIRWFHQSQILPNIFTQFAACFDLLKIFLFKNQNIQKKMQNHHLFLLKSQNISQKITITNRSLRIRENKIRETISWADHI